MIDLLVIGGGPAGLFAAITAKDVNPSASVVLLEKSGVLLSKVRISGGGRCNVTHGCFDPASLVGYYPRGNRELLGPFHYFQPQNTVDWFESRGVRLKTEVDGRMFPTSDRSETIVNCLLAEAQDKGVDLRLRQRIQTIVATEEGFEVTLADHSLCCKRLLLATGSSPDGHRWAASLGHSIQSPVPSLFTFNVPDSPLKELSGISVNPVTLHLEGTSFSQTGPLLLTHFGFSGPAILKLSAWAARYLHEKEYRSPLIINWLPQVSEEHIVKQLKNNPNNPFHLPKNLWKVLATKCLHADPYLIQGKTTNKEEFVTCGGVALREVDFRTMQSKITPGLFFAGEILDVDGITGGFNFQNAWTTGFLAGRHQ